MASIAAHLNAEVILSDGDSVKYSLPLLPPPGIFVPPSTSSETTQR